LASSLDLVCLVDVQLQGEKLDLFGFLMSLIWVLSAKSLKVAEHHAVSLCIEGIQEPLVQFHVMILCL
jgi:hypothetical protein